MQLKQTNCSSCSIFESTYQICCVGIYLCRDCLLDQSILDQYYICPVCNRQLAGAYRPLIAIAQYNQPSYEINSGLAMKQTNNFSPYQQHHISNSFHAQNHFQSSREDEEFNFVHNLAYQNTQTKRNQSSNNIACFNHNYYGQTRQNYNQGLNVQNMSLNPPKNGFRGNMQQKDSFQGLNSSQNQPNFKQLNQPNNIRPNYTNNMDFNRGNSFQNSSGQNLGYLHNENMMNHTYNSGNYVQDSQNYSNFSQNIRQRNHQSKNMTDNRFQNMPSQTGQFSRQSNAHQGKNTNPFSIFNQQQSNGNFHLNNFNSHHKNSSRNEMNCVNHNNGFANEHQINQASKGQSSNQRIVKSAIKMRRQNHSPLNGNRSSFKVAEYEGEKRYIPLHNQKDASQQKDLSPTFGFQSNDLSLGINQNDKYGPNMNNLSTIRTALEEETREVIKMRRSNSQYTLGSRQ